MTFTTGQPLVDIDHGGADGATALVSESLKAWLPCRSPVAAAPAPRPADRYAPRGPRVWLVQMTRIELRHREHPPLARAVTDDYARRVAALDALDNDIGLSRSTQRVVQCL
jgi:hypothetical protein